MSHSPHHHLPAMTLSAHSESRERFSRDGMSHESLTDFESQKIKEDCALRCRDGIFLHAVLWFMSVSPGIVDGLLW